LVVLVAIQLFVLGLYLPPVLKVTGGLQLAPSQTPPQTIISLSVHSAVCQARAEGALAMLVAIQLSVLGLYLPPVFQYLPMKSTPPQIIISLPVHTAVCPFRVEGALIVLVAVQVSVIGLYLPPVPVG
jgi:hypothetical protein